MVASSTPADGTTGRQRRRPVTANSTSRCSRPRSPARTFLLKDSSGNTVPATVSYDSSTQRGDAEAAGRAEYGATYRAVLTGRRREDSAGNALATDASWSFTTEAAPPPLLVVTSSANPFGSYLGEILRNEGLDAFTTLDSSLLSPAVLANFDVVLLGDAALSSAR